jgi:hypothetical protein
VRPNPSLNRTRYGRQRKPGPRHMVHHRVPGLRCLPPRARLAPTLGFTSNPLRMAEISEKLQRLPDTEILMRFREALVALLPILQELDCVGDDTSLYDPFDRIAESLWNELVLESLRWKYGVESKPVLPRYGFTGSVPEADGYIQVQTGERELQFVGFIGDRKFGEARFNAVQATSSSGSSERIALSPDITFHWQRGPSEA